MLIFKDYSHVLVKRYDANIIKEMMRKSAFAGCLGILEYDPNLKEGKAQYRQMFSRVGKFKETEIVRDIAYDRQLIKDLFNILKTTVKPKRRRNDIVLFVHQRFIMAKKIKQAGIEIMQMSLETSSSLVRAQRVKWATRKGSKDVFDALWNQNHL
ncbi:hypothetical protein BGZ89_000446 [Linnemannia elongata]|nr:hypothetical protein BGZ89_000446 [Linnemannia elongata]